MGTISIRTKILLALGLPLLTAVVLLGWGASRYLDTSETEVRNYLLLSGGLMVAVTALTAFLAWRTVRPIEHLAQDAQAVVDVRLPALLDRMRTADSSDELRLARIEVSSRDEIGQLAESFNRVQEATVGVAVDQSALLRRGIGDLFVQLSKRNQDLVNRQLAFIDELEANEEDPDQLESLFHLDHLATRMQRNAEALMVLADQQSQPATGEAVELHDVVRVAQGEVEGFSRITVGDMVQASVDSRLGVDLAHLMAELLENATMYSPADSDVTISSETDGSAVAISIVDAGPGLDPDRLRAANQLLADPPLLGLTGAANLGWNLVSRLAARHRVHVELRQTADSGLQAIVVLRGDQLLGAPAAVVPVTEEPGDLLFEAGVDEPVGDGADALASLMPDPEPWSVEENIDVPEPAAATTIDADTPEPGPTPTPDDIEETIEPAAATTIDADTPEPGPTPTPDDIDVPEPAAATTIDTDTPEPGPTPTPDDIEETIEPASAGLLPTRTPMAGPGDTVEATPSTIVNPGGDLFADPDPFAPVADTRAATASEPPVHTPVPADAPEVPFGSMGADVPGAEAVVAASGTEEAEPVDEVDDGEVTAAGLARRTPTTDRREHEQGDRSPEDLRRLLSRYRSSLGQGRADEPDLPQETDR